MAKGFRTLHNAVRSQFKTQVVDTSSLIGLDDVAWDNATFEGQDAADTNAGVWVRFQVLMGDSQQLDLGLAPAKTNGIALASVFTLGGAGDKVALTLADEVVSAFRKTTVAWDDASDGVLTNVVFQSPTVRNIGRDGAWFQTNVSIPFFTTDA